VQARPLSGVVSITGITSPVRAVALRGGPKVAVPTSYVPAALAGAVTTRRGVPGLRTVATAAVTLAPLHTSLRVLIADATRSELLIWLHSLFAVVSSRKLSKMV